MKAKRICIIGGGAAGASVAARARRLDENARITMFERGEHVSFANCGLPYYIGNVIKNREKLFIVTPRTFDQWFAVEVRTRHEVAAIDRTKKEIRVRDLVAGTEYAEPYDTLVLAPGASPLRPPIEGIDLPGIFTVRTVPDSDTIIAWIRQHEAKSALVVGGGFIGLEMTENLRNLGMRVTVVEMLPRLAAFLDPEIAVFLEDQMVTHGVELVLGDGVARISRAGDTGAKEGRAGDTGAKEGRAGDTGAKEGRAGDTGAKEGRARNGEGTTGVSGSDKLTVVLSSGREVRTDIVILAIGVRPESGLARDAGLSIGNTGGIVVDGTMRTSDPDIYALGDNVEITDVLFPDGPRFIVPLAGPAQRQGRIAAEAICGAIPASSSIVEASVADTMRVRRTFRGSQRTAVCGIFGFTAACTGASERSITMLNGKTGAGIAYEKIYVSPLSSAGYYPGGSPLFIKLIFDPKTGRVLGAQAAGMKGAEKRIDVISMAIQMGASVFDLEEAELAYAPQYNAAKDPVNIAGMVAANAVRGLQVPAHWESLPSASARGAFILDVRTVSEFESGHAPGAVNLPLHTLRSELDSLPRNKDIWVYCQRGQRSYYATRILMQKGFRVKNISGGFVMYDAVKRAGLLRD